MKAKINLLVIVDTAIDYLPQIEKSLERQRQDYLAGTGGDVDVVWDIKRQDLSGLNWVEYGYGANNYGVSTAWIVQDTGKIKGEYYSVAYVIKYSNWTRKGNIISGWSAGFYNGYHVQLIKAYENNITANYTTFLMELIHGFNEYAMSRLGVNFNTLFNIGNWDEDVIHARHRDYTVFEYRPVIEKMNSILVELFKINQKYMEDVTLVFDPLTEKGSRDRKIYRLNRELMQRAHLNNPEYFIFTYGAKAWADVGEISKEEFFFYREVGPAGFEQDFKSSWLQQIIKLFSKKS